MDRYNYYTFYLHLKIWAWLLKTVTVDGCLALDLNAFKHIF